ncbi:hypothetical protein [Pedobacter mendelii]|uniref:Uncharacterized protein n=1 Tax=Pedobacter mendelii TaxID=1908240 RepID=A0ABQ2BG87_9SPHI|nr:hypothetical protein [Pedobacter mendelii]GGI23874.1 hypothetical protein GCM10008119_09840 [Pedobacter mendelii]
MIKLSLLSECKQLNSYFIKVGSLVIKRLKNLKRSIQHIQNIGLSEDEPDFVGYKLTTQTLVKLQVSGLKSKPNPFNKETYVATVQQHFSVAQKFGINNLDVVVNFVDRLLDNDAENLKYLLLCPPQLLSTKNKELLQELNGENSVPFQIMQIAFDYETCTDIAVAIKKFFRKHNLTDYCPYCNMGDTIYIETEKQDPATVHQLDHFFGKAGNALLGYSLYNLVPADVHCNGAIGKGQIPFDDVYHLNPYQSGIGKGLTFRTIRLGDIITGTELVVSGKKGDEMFDKLLGKGGKVNEASKSGNINVFKLKAKYNGKTYLKKANLSALKISKQAGHIKTDSEFFELMNKDVRWKAHKEWFEHEVETYFEENDFGSERFSKAIRDLHDEIFLKDTRPENQWIRDFIAAGK